MPALGGGQTLRGYTSFRFRDRHTPAPPGRVPLGPEPARPRHGAVLGRRHRRAGVDRARRSGRSRTTSASAFACTPGRDADPRRAGLRRGRLQAGASPGRRRSDAARARCPIGLAPARQAWRGAAGPRFLPDDPLTVEPETQDAGKAQPRDIELIWDLAENLFSRPGDPALDVRAQNVNTIDEVPDSSWFTNRILAHPLLAGGGGARSARRHRPGPRSVDWSSRRRAPASPRLPHARQRRHPVVRFARSDRLQRIGQRRPARRQQALLGARLLPGRELPGQLQSGAADARAQRPHPGRVRAGAADAPPGPRRRAGPGRPGARRHAIARSPPGRCQVRPSAGSSTTARVPTIRTTSSRTSIAASCAP